MRWLAADLRSAAGRCTGRSSVPCPPAEASQWKRWRNAHRPVEARTRRGAGPGGSVLTPSATAFASGGPCGRGSPGCAGAAHPHRAGCRGLCSVPRTMGPWHRGRHAGVRPPATGHQSPSTAREARATARSSPPDHSSRWCRGWSPRGPAPRCAGRWSARSGSCSTPRSAARPHRCR